MTEPPPPASRRALRAAVEKARPAPSAPRRAARRRGIVVLSATAAVLVWAVVAILFAVFAPGDTDRAGAPAADRAPAPWATALPVPTLQGATPPEPSAEAAEAAAPAPTDGICTEAALTAALAAGDDAAVIAAAGGAAAFRERVASGAAPCIDLADPERVWVVVNKQRPYAQLEYAPSALVAAGTVADAGHAILRTDAAAALAEMIAAARAAGAGEVGAQNGYRAYGTQRSIYAAQVAQRGAAGADLVSARPGFSEHQSGLAVDVVPCDPACGTLDDLAGTPADAWIREHAWEYGWIVRYEEGYTAITGYAHEPWHLRYIGADLARAYREGGFHSLEEFFELPPAPDYAD
ncbi:M15 family metallopeptidase [Microbacterium pullorum]|uniref:M15 family metallopeptidase n=1 Tax=Microbacterium pullorum TaxID=2762236 RepID=UPI00296AA7FF|nr:M15 family metallopeptidase [Microbacterium pullorum]